MIGFTVISTLMFLFLSVIWSSKTWANIFLKLAFILLAIYGVLLIASLNMVTV